MKKWLAKNLFKMANRTLKNTKHEGNITSIIITMVAIIFVFIVFFIATVLAIFHYFFCTITFGLSDNCKRDEKGKVAITEEELDHLAQRMIDARIHVNKNGRITPGYEGEEYGSDGKLPSQNYQQFCGPYSGQFSDLINKYGAEYEIDPQLIAAIIKQESNFDPNAASGAGAAGLMQLMPGTADGLGVTDRYDPEQSIMGGAKYIRQMLNGESGNMELALAAYNWGPGNLSSAKAVHGSDWASIKPFAPKETQNYVTKVMNNYNDFGKDAGSCASAAGGSETTWQNGTSEKITAKHLEKFLKGGLAGAGEYIIKYAKEYNMDPVFVTAIMMHETGNGSNYKAYGGYYNFGGIKCASEAAQDKFGFSCKLGEGGNVKWSAFPSKEKGVQYMTYLLKTYADDGLDTVGAVQQKYCPNSDDGCNEWQPGVNANMDEIYKLAGVQRSYEGIAQPTQDEVVADASVGVFPLPKNSYKEFSDTWGDSRQSGKRSHEGTDILAPNGTPIYSATDGTITKKGWNQYGGWTYSIRVGDLTMYYAHMSKYVGDGDGKQSLKQGDNVKRGQLLGYVGHTGSQEGAKEGTVNPNMVPHLHFGMYQNGEAINPYPTLKKWEGNYGGVSGQTVVDTIDEILKENGGKGAKTDFCYGYSEKGPVIINPCRDFVQTVFKKVDIEVGATPAKQFVSSNGKDVPLADATDGDFTDEDISLQPGDVLFFGDKDVKKEGKTSEELLKNYPDYYAEKDGKLYGVKWTGIYVGTDNMKRKIVLVDDKGTIFEDYVDTEWEKSQLIGAKRFISSLEDGGRANSGLGLQIDGHLTDKEEAMIHIRSLMQTDMYALAGTGLKESEVKTLQEKIDQEPKMDKIVGEKYKGTYIDKTWQMVKQHRQRLLKEGKQMGVDAEDVAKWTLEEEFMNLRLTAYSCYLAWDDTGFFVGESDKPCDYINKLYQEATGETDDYIPFAKQGVLLHIQETTYIDEYCVANESEEDPKAIETSTNNTEAVIESMAITEEAEVKETLWKWVEKLLGTFKDNFPESKKTIERLATCGEGETKKRDKIVIREVKYKLLIEDVLMNFEEFSLLEPGVSTDEDEPYSYWILFFLQEAYKRAGGSLTVGGGGSVGGNISIPSSGIFKSPIPPEAANGQWTITSEYGLRDIGPVGSTNHLGIDIAFYHGVPGVESDGSGPTIYSVEAGTVTYADWMDGYGNVVFIKHANGYASVYAHMKQKPSVSVGQTVEAGAPLGKIGSTGNSTGPHLHLTICKDGPSCRQKINPREVIKLPALDQAASSFTGW